MASPSTFRGVTTLRQPVCSSAPSIGLRCSYSVIIGDNEPVPLQPNLENSGGANNDIEKFLVWLSSTDSPYMNFDFGGAQSVTAITIEFLNYPAQGFFLPNLQLYSTSSLTPTLILKPNLLNLSSITIVFYHKETIRSPMSA